jgi:PAS domain S-box-containing protein
MFTPVTLVYALALVAYLALAVKVLARRERTRLHWSCALVLGAFAVWSVEDIVHGIPGASMSLVRLAADVGSLGWGGFAAANLVFTMVLTRNTRLLRKWWFLMLAAGLPVMVVAAQLTGNINAGYSLNALGWRTVWADSVWVWLYYAYYLSFTVAALYLLLRFRRLTRLFRERRQADIILGTGLSALVLGSLSDIVLARVPGLELPDLAGALCLVWAGGLYVAVTRYGLMSVTAQAAADEIVATMGDGLLLLTPEGTVALANQAAGSLLGTTAVELRTRPAQELFAQPADFRAALARIRAGETLTAADLEGCGRDGRRVPLSVSSRMLRDRGGEILGSVWVLHDMTLRRAAEDRLAQLVKELEVANSELSDFAHVVSHDLKAPLRAIDSLVRWIADDYADKFDAAGREHVNLLLGRVKRMADLIDGILRYSSAGRTHEPRSTVALAPLIRGVVDSLGAPAHIRVVTEGEFPVVSGNRTRFEQVFQNLIGNAIRYMDKPQGLVRVGCTAEEGLWKFYVADNGPGIEEKDFERVFQLFTTLKPRDRSESTGVGLAVVKKVVEMYGGRVWLESEPGQGSTFYFTLPRTGPAPCPDDDLKGG